MTDLDNLADSGQRDAGGRFVAGHRGLGGRPKGLDFRRLVTEHHGELAMEAALVAVFDALLTASKSGDVAAARLLLDRLADDAKDGNGSVNVTILTGVPQPEDDPPQPPPAPAHTVIASNFG